FFWTQLKQVPPRDWQTACAPLRKIFWDEIIGRFPSPALPMNARSRLVKISDSTSNPAPSFAGGEGPTPWTAYEVVLDVYPDVFAWGYLLLPKGLKPGERRPVVVCQHGLEGVPADVISSDQKSRGYGFYKAFAARLAERGFVVFAPHNPYRGENRFRQLQREANPLGKSLFSIVIAQHPRILDWLSQQPFVAPAPVCFHP